MSASREHDSTYERFQLLLNAPALFNAMATAVDLRIFAFLRQHAGADIDRIRDFTGIPAHQLRVLLHAVCATGLITRRNGAYSNSPVADELLATDAPDSWSHVLVGWRDFYYPAFAHMTTALRTGTNTALDDYPGDEPTLYQRLAHDPAREAVFHRAMSAFTLRVVDALAECDEFSTVRHLLDVGGGDGTTSARLSMRHPHLRLTVFDMPSVSKMAEGNVGAGLPSRVELRSGDIFGDPFPSGPDGILFSHVLEIFSAARIAHLLGKAYDALPPGGRIFIYGFNASSDETEGIFSARLGLYFNVLASGEGMAYPAADYENWLRAAGFGDVHTIGGLPFEHGLTVGAKPGGGRRPT
ncbi:methyltransferase [Streptosporangium sandarakinum]|uniref:methyltransferase n=1 Tax=Streptosporangium sandarakinum TaxID=1260955 RepID=UPI0034471C3F